MLRLNKFEKIVPKMGKMKIKFFKRRIIKNNCLLQQPSNFLTDEYYNPRKLRLTKIKINEIFTAKIFHDMKKLYKILSLGGVGGNFPGGFISGGNFPGGTFPGGIFPVGIFPGGIFPGGIFPSTDIYKLSNDLEN